MEIPLPEMLDRMSIVQLKIERIGEPYLKKELEAYKNALEEFKEKGIQIKQEWIDELYKINGKIWDLESDVRAGKEKEIGLEKVGMIALAIREINKKRVAIKNKVVEETGMGFKDVKMNHVSE